MKKLATELILIVSVLATPASPYAKSITDYVTVKLMLGSDGGAQNGRAYQAAKVT